MNLVFDILNDVSESITIKTMETIVTSLKSYLGEKVSTLEEFDQNFDIFKYYTEILNNYKKFGDENIKNYLEKRIQNKDENPFVKYVIAYSLTFEMDSTCLIVGINKSVSKFVSTCWMTHVNLSKPAPVSTCFLGKSVRLPSASRL